jgi:hypothetical protein
MHLQNPPVTQIIPGMAHHGALGYHGNHRYPPPPKNDVKIGANPALTLVRLARP